MGKTFILTTVLAAVLLGLCAGSGAETPGSGTPAPTLAPGERLAPFDAPSARDGAMQPVRFPKGKVTVLVFFLSSCHVCHDMIPEWNRAFARRDDGVNVVGLMLDQAPSGFLAKMDIRFPVLLLSPSLRGQLKIFRVPQTIRIVDGGRVEDVALGKIDAMRVGELFRPPDPPQKKARRSNSKG